MVSSPLITRPFWQRWQALLLVAVLVLVFLSADLFRSYQREIAFAQRNNENIARVLDEHLHATFTKIDVVLQSAVTELQPAIRSGQTTNINVRLHDLLQRIPESQSLRIVNAQGNVVFDASGIPPSGNIADRRYFTDNRDQPDAGLVISEPIYARFTKNWVVTLSRQLRDEQGNFLGLIQAAVRAEYFDRFFKTLNLGEDGLVSLMYEDLTLFVRTPPPPPAMQGALLSGTSLQRELEDGKHSGHYLTRAATDQIQRWHYFRRASAYPFIYVVGTATQEIFADVYWKASVYAGFTVILLLVLAIMVNSWKHRHRDALALAETMTEQFKQANAQLQQSQAELLKLEEERRLLIQNLPVGVYKYRVLASGEARFDYVSPRWCEQLGLAMEEVMANPQLAFATLHPDDLATFNAEVAAVNQSRQPFSWQGRILRDGQLRWMQIDSTPTVEANGDLIWNGVQVDITERKHAEERLIAAEQAAQAASVAKSQFLANTSHEIRTPMNGVLGMLQLLEHSALDETQVEYVDTAKECAKGLLVVLNDILDFSKIEAGRMLIEVLPFDLPRCMRELVASFEFQAQHKGIVLSCQLADGLPVWVAGDVVRIRQILVNLLSNAVKFTEAGQVSLQVLPRGDGHLEFSVTDSGIGMSEEAVGQLFAAFTQADATITRKFGGTGLGLSITKRLVELMGGRITVHSTPGEGSRFTVVLPLANAVPPELPASVIVDAQHSDLRGRTVLVVEDNRSNQQVIAGMLQSSGIQVVFADNGVKALAALPSLNVDLILMDCMMPEMDGYETTRQIRAGIYHPDVPIIALTANAMKGDMDLCLAAGMNDYLGKPIDMEELISKLRRWLGASPVVFSGQPVLAESTIPATPGQGVCELDHLVVFHPDSMLRLLGGSEELARDIAPSFLEDLQVQRQSLRGAIEQGELEVARRVAHTLKGLAGQMGGLRLQLVMQQLEHLLAQQQVPEAALLQQGEDEADALIAALQAW